MKTLVLWATCLTLCHMLATRAFAAADPPQLPAEPRGQIVILANDNTLTGKVDKIEGGYRLRSSRGESILPDHQVLRVCDTLDQAYTWLKSRANLRDPHERLRLARWCAAQGLTAEARAEAQAALDLAPRSESARHLLRQLDDTADVPPNTPAVDRSSEHLSRERKGAEARESLTCVGGSNADARGAEQAVALAKPLEGWEKVLTKAATKEFTLRIQPIVLNGCGTGACHGGEDSRGGFLLKRPPSEAAHLPNLTRHNLAQTLALINRQNAGQSPLLKKALEPHGGAARAPLASPDNPAYRTLASWVHHLAPPALEAGAPALGEHAPPAAPPIAPGFAETREPEAGLPAVLPAARAPEELTKDEALKQLLERRTPGTNPADRAPGAIVLPPLPDKDELDKLQKNKVPGLLNTGTPPMLGGGHIVGRPARGDGASTAPPIRAVERQGAAGENEKTATEPPALNPPSAVDAGNDPYDPAPFNRFVKQRQSGRGGGRP
jgi:hypothetical protein